MGLSKAINDNQINYGVETVKRIHAAFMGIFIFVMTHPTIVAAQSSGGGNGNGGGNGHGRGNGHGGGQPLSVPEIDASTGALALAALGAALVLAWEINRRQKTS